MVRYTGMMRLFPMPGASEDGFVSTDKDIIRQSIMNLIKTHKGSRVYDPDYGTNIHRLIHELNIQRTRNIAKNEIEAVITKYEPRAKIIEVNAYPGEDDKASDVIIIVTVLYVEYGEQEDLEIRLASEQTWISEEGTHVDPMEEWFRSRMS